MKKTLFDQWREKAYNSSMSQDDIETFWNKFNKDEKMCYKKLLDIKNYPILGTVEHFVKMFNVDIITFIGFLDGLNNSLKTPNNLENLTMQTIITLDYDTELLYKNMKEANFDLSIWDNSEYNKPNVNKMNIVNKILSSQDKKTFYYYIHINDFLSAKNIINKYCNCNDEEFHSILELYIEEYSKDQEVVSVNKEAQELLNKPKCPTCGSTNIKKISGTKRFVTTGLFGLASSNIGKTMECKNCGYKW